MVLSENFSEINGRSSKEQRVVFFVRAYFALQSKTRIVCDIFKE